MNEAQFFRDSDYTHKFILKVTDSVKEQINGVATFNLSKENLDKYPELMLVYFYRAYWTPAEIAKQLHCILNVYGLNEEGKVDSLLLVTHAVFADEEECEQWFQGIKDYFLKMELGNKQC